MFLLPFCPLFVNDFISVADRRKRRFNLERVGQYLQNQNLQKLSRLSINSDWSKLLEENECLKNSSYIYPHRKKLSLVQEHNNLKESIRRLFERPDTLISAKLQKIYDFDICGITHSTPLYWHQVDLDEPDSTLFAFTLNSRHCHVIQFLPRSQYMKVASFYLSEVYENPGAELNQRFPEMKLVHTQFYNQKSMSMLFTYKKDKPTANCFVQFPIELMLSRLVAVEIQLCFTMDRNLPLINYRELLDPDLVRPLDISDGLSLSVSGGRKIATIISSSRKKFYHFEMEVDEADFDDDDDNENAENDTENDAMGVNANE